MLIRNFRSGDEPALFAVFLSAIHEIASRDYSPEQINAWAPRNLDQELWGRRIRSISPFVAQADGAIIGYGDVQWSGYIDHFFVSGSHQRRGVGRALMQQIHAAAAQRGLTELSADVSHTAQPFFEHFGFHVVEYREPVIRGVVVPNAHMRKALTIQFMPASTR